MAEDQKCERCSGFGTLHRQDCGSHSLTVGCPDCGGTGGRCKCERCDTLIKHRHGSLCAACIADDMDYDPVVDGRYEFDEFDDCGLMPDGRCMKAGSEECDWECGRLN